MPFITINLLTKKQVVYADFWLKVVIGNIPFYFDEDTDTGVVSENDRPIIDSLFSNIIDERC
jgi:hypothetical protein